MGKPTRMLNKPWRVLDFKGQVLRLHSVISAIVGCSYVSMIEYNLGRVEGAEVLSAQVGCRGVWWQEDY